MAPNKILLLLLFAFSNKVFAQQTKIKIIDTKKIPIVGATVQLKDRADSTKIFNKITDTTGIATFALKSGNSYLLSVTSIGYKAISKGIKIMTNNVVFTYEMTEDNQQLGGVSVVARKPLMKQEDDKTIIDPEPLAATSTSAYEIMEKTPGLFLDQDGNIYISSATPATIFINGREQKMSAVDIATVLKSLPPNSIEKIEIMRTPSAKYDASGSGGVVNVVLKKGVNIGRTGSINAGMNQGRFGNQFVGINLNNSNGGKTSYLNINYNHRNSYEQLQTTRRVSDGSFLSQESYTTTPANVLFAGYGLGRELGKKWQLNYDGRLSFNDNKTLSENLNKQYKTSENDLFSNNLNKVLSNSNALTLSQEIEAKYKIDSLGSEWTTAVSYNYFERKTDQNLATNFTIPKVFEVLGAGNFANHRNFLTLQTDLKYKFPKKFTFEAGFKSSLQKFGSQTDYFSIVQGVNISDPKRSNKYEYREGIYAGYLQASKTLGDFVMKAGIRGENTNMQGRQLFGRDTIFKINRLDFFPYIYLSRKIMKISGYELRGFLISRRSISRPVYEYLNPSIKVIDQYLYEVGNPSLRPQFTQTYETNISVDNMPIFAFGKNFTKDIFSNVIYQDPKNPSIAVRTYDNVGTNEETYFRLIGAIPPGKAYFFVVGSQFGLNKYKGIYENSPLNFSRGTWSFFTFHQYKIDPKSTIQLNGFLRTKGQLQFYELSNFGNVNLSINRAFLDRKLTISASINDIFYTNKNTFTFNQGTISAVGSRRADTRRVGINIRYNFGRKKKDEGSNPFNFDALEKASN